MSSTTPAEKSSPFCSPRLISKGCEDGSAGYEPTLLEEHLVL